MRLTEDQKTLAVALLKGGYSIRDVAKHFGVEHGYMRTWASHNAGRKRGRPKFGRMTEQHKRVMRLYAEMRTYKEIGAVCGITKQRVCDIVNRWKKFKCA